MSNKVDRTSRTQFTYPVLCPSCGEKGSETWEENSTINERGPQSQFIKRTAEFYERLAKKPPHQIEVVCQKCGAVVPD